MAEIRPEHRKAAETLLHVRPIRAQIIEQVAQIIADHAPDRHREGWEALKRYDLHYGKACDQTDENGCSAEMEESPTGEWVKFADIAAHHSQ